MRGHTFRIVRVALADAIGCFHTVFLCARFGSQCMLALRVFELRTVR
jgi:hypothetical protein